MRLLNVDTFQLEEFFHAPPPYAILSHTWGKDSEEVSFLDVTERKLNTAETLPIKVTGCCKQAKKDGYKYVWIDTCCIDKRNAVELGEAINSMFRWYQEAHICYAFLSDVSADDEPRDPQSRLFSCKWFQRGWTLQELLAPQIIRFYGSDWRPLGTKGDLCDVIEQITGIPIPFLLGITELHQASVAQRMSWAAGRATKRKEDIAYCLLGIFGVSMVMIYGEGAKAFRRLQEQIMRDIADDSILAWGLDPEEQNSDSSSVVSSGGVLATAPSDFVNCGQIASRKRPTIHSVEVHGGSLRLHLSLFTTTVGKTFGLLACGPEHDPDRVVGIPLATDSGESTNEFMRPKGRRSLLISKPETQIPTKLIQTRIAEHKPPSASGQSYWFRIQKFVSGVELIEVEPPLRWHRERALIEVVVDPGIDRIPRTLIRFRDQRHSVFHDFIVMLELDATTLGMRARCNVMIASRHTSSQDVMQKFSDIRPEALGKQSASNGRIQLYVTLQLATTPRMFILMLDTLASSPAATISATAELQHLDLMTVAEHVQKAEDRVAREEAKLNQNLKKKRNTLAEMEKEMKRVQKVLGKLREKERLLSQSLDDGHQEINDLKARCEEVERRHGTLSVQRSQTQELLDKRLDSGPFSARNDQMLHWVAQHGFDAVVEILLDRDANVAEKDIFGRTPLHIAALNGHEAATRILLDNGANVAERDIFGRTPLHITALNGHEAATKLLLDRSAKVTDKDEDHQTPLHYAALSGQEKITRILLKRGFSVHDEDWFGRTPLHLAAENGHDKVSTILLEQGASAAIKDFFGGTPLDLLQEWIDSMV